MITGLILLGGQASRAENQPKYLFRFGKESFLDRQIRVLREVADEIIISCRDSRQASELEGFPADRIVTDELHNHGPAEGLRTGVLSAAGNLVVVVACDMPLLSPVVLKYLISRVGDAEGAVPVWPDGNQEPLHAVYRRDALRTVLSGCSLCRLREITSQLRIAWIQVGELREMDPHLETFTNINDLPTYYRLEKKD